MELLPEHAAGTLPAGVAAEVHAHVAGCESCRDELTALEEVFAQMALALPAASPPPSLRARLLAAVETGSRFERFVERVAALLDVGVARARELTRKIDEAAGWRPGPAVSRILHLPPGPRVATANCGFVRVRGGDRFPTHRHLGTERVLVLQGGFVDSEGRRFVAGDEDVAEAGTAHAFTAVPGPDLVFLVLIDVGIDLDGGGEI